jgi:dTDP-4-dehydrorhamnose reductase
LLEDRAIVLAGLKAARPDVVINAAAYTVVDQGEAKESRARISVVLASSKPGTMVSVPSGGNS